MNRTRALVSCTRPGDCVPTRVRQAAKHLLAQGDVSEEEKQLATKALEGLRSPTEETRSSPRPKVRRSAAITMTTTQAWPLTIRAMHGGRQATGPTSTRRSSRTIWRR
jgi:hypothetical protein